MVLPRWVRSACSSYLKVALGAALLGINQAATINFQGPLSRMLGGDLYGADIGFPLALVVTAVVYFILRRIELARFKR